MPGERGFTEFPRLFLYRDVHADMLSTVLSPSQLAKMAGFRVNRTDAIAEYLDRSLFEGRTFQDLSSNGRNPNVINAMDMNTGATFSFTQMQFDYLCLDLSKFPVTRAVMASAAVPLVFAPIALRNYPGQCLRCNPLWVRQALAERNPAVRRFHAATALASYADAEAVAAHAFDDVHRVHELPQAAQYAVGGDPGLCGLKDGDRRIRFGGCRLTTSSASAARQASVIRIRHPPLPVA